MKHLKKPLLQITFSCLLLVLITGFVAWYDCSLPFGTPRRISPEEAALREQYVRTAEHYLGTKEGSAQHRAIIDRYNHFEPLAQNYTVSYQDSWCSAFVSSIAIECGITDILPTECGCQRHIRLFQDLHHWEESDSYMPLPGDLIFFDWDEWGFGDSTGWSDHVGIVVGVRWPFLKVIEGNRSDSVCYHFVPIGHPNIRGFALPDYPSLCIQ